MGEDYFRMPWANLKYDTNSGGYRLALLRTSSRHPEDSIETPIGIGQISPATRKSTTATGRLFRS